MRATATAGDFRAKAIAGTHTVLLAIDCAEPRRQGLLGFAIKREIGGGGQAKWLASLKVFKSVIATPQVGAIYTSDKFPIQSFLWGDYTAKPDTAYKFSIVPMYGTPAALQPQPAVEISVRTEKEFDQDHGVWFNRGAIASQAFAREFQNKAPDNPEDPNDKETAWLSRGLLEACLAFINGTPQGDGLRVAAYEFTYAPILNALKAALDRGVDRQDRLSRHHDGGGTPKKTPMKTPCARRACRSTIRKSPSTARARRSRTTSSSCGSPAARRNRCGPARPISPIPASSANPMSAIWSSTTTRRRIISTSGTFSKTTPSAPSRAPAPSGSRPNPPPLVAKNSISRVFSPRQTANMLTWYGDRMLDATSTVMFTAAFGVAKQLIGPLAKERNFLRFVLMERPPAGEAKAQLTADRDLIISYGAVLSDMYTVQGGKAVAKGKIAEFDLEKWYFEKEALYRKQGNIFYIHTKFLLVDALSDDPLTCSGSANFSANSLQQNDENMLLIRGNTRVADIYMTEFDRIFRHFYFRDIANQLAKDGKGAADAFLCETSAWTDGYFKPNAFKTKRREMFFATPAKKWTDNAANDAALPPEVAKPARKTAAKKKATVKKKKPAKNKSTAKKKSKTKTKTKKKRKAKAKKKL